VANEGTKTFEVRAMNGMNYAVPVNMVVIRDGSVALCIQRTCLEGGLIEMWGLQHGVMFTSSPKTRKKASWEIKRDSTEFS